MQTLRSGGDKDFNTFVDICNAYANDLGEPNLLRFGDVSRKVFFHKDDVKAIFGQGFIDGLKNSVKSEINPLLKEKINFAIVKKGGAYDLEPYLDFPK